MCQPLRGPWHAALTPVRRILNCKRCREDHTHNESMSDAVTASLRSRNTGRPKCGVHLGLWKCTTSSEMSLVSAVQPSASFASHDGVSIGSSAPLHAERRFVRNEARNSPGSLETALITTRSRVGVSRYCSISRPTDVAGQQTRLGQV